MKVKTGKKYQKKLSLNAHRNQSQQHVIEILNTQKFEAKFKLSGFSIETSSGWIRFSIKSLIEAHESGLREKTFSLTELNP